VSATAAQQQTDLVTLTIDGVEVRVPKGTLLVEAAKTIHTDIPVYCYHEKLGPAGLCRICLVEIEGMPKLQTACSTPVRDGMVVYTQTDQVQSWLPALPGLPGHVGEEVTVAYDPAHPGRAAIDSFAESWIVPLVVAGLGLIALLLGLAVPLFTGPGTKANQAA